MSNTLELNQRIVYAGLLRMSADRNIVKSAFSHWNGGNSNEPVDIFEVVASLVDYLGLEVAEKKALMLGMHTASAQLYDDLKPVPAFILGEQGGSAAAAQESVAQSSAAKKAPHLEVTTRFLQLVSLNIKRNDAKTHKELVKAVADEGLGGMEKVVSKWSADNLNLIEFSSSVSVQECQDLAHEFYVLVCDFLGPVETDIIVNRVVGELSSLEASREFSPSKLL